jgi:hypothetical protein
MDIDYGGHEKRSSKLCCATFSDVRTWLKECLT